VPAAPAPAPPFALVEGEVVELVPEVISTIPHPTDAFTQGLEIHDGLFYESTGLYGQSEVRIFEPDGTELAAAPVDAELFGEGMTRVDDRLIQITWREQTALVWDAETLAPLGRFAYEGEGWGICLDGDRLVMSDGTAALAFRDPDTFEALGSVEVTLTGRPVEQLNELECVGGLVMANVWLTDTIVIVDPDTGVVAGTIDAAGLQDALSSTEGIDVLNGIAWDEDTGSLYLTGKLWPEIFEVELVPAG
jgi:glutaminyl-peptide cyclotransferase